MAKILCQSCFIYISIMADNLDSETQNQDHEINRTRIVWNQEVLFDASSFCSFSDHCPMCLFQWATINQSFIRSNCYRVNFFRMELFDLLSAVVSVSNAFISNYLRSNSSTSFLLFWCLTFTTVTQDDLIYAVITVQQFLHVGTYPHPQAPLFLLVPRCMHVLFTNNNIAKCERKNYFWKQPFEKQFLKETFLSATISWSNYLMAVVSVSSLVSLCFRRACFSLEGFSIQNLSFSFFQTLSCDKCTFNYDIETY